MKKIKILCFSALLSFSNLTAALVPVTSLDDSGSGTLREALTSPQTGDFIIFDSELSGTITLESALPEINTAVAVFGPSSGLVTLDGNNLYPLFIVHVDAFFLSQLNLSNGVKSGGGGAIYVDLDNYAELFNLNITIGSGEDAVNPLYADLDGEIVLSNVTFSSSDTPEIYLNTASLVIANTITTDSIVDGTGIIDTDGDTVNLATPSSDPVNLFIEVNSGTTSFNGNTENSILIFPDATFYGTFSADALANYGTMQMGDPSTLAQNQLTTLFYQDSGGTFEVKIDPSGDSDQLNITGFTFLGGTLTLLPASGTYIENTTYTILNMDDFFMGTFDVVTPVSGLDFQVNYTDHTVVIEILSTSTI